MIDTAINSILHVDQRLTVFSAQHDMWTYTILFLITFCETGLVTMPLLPGNSLLFTAGGIVTVDGMNIHIMILILLTTVVLGDTVNFMIGKYFGAELFSNPDSRIFHRVYPKKTRMFYKGRGGKTIIITHFAPIVRTFAPLVASMGDMHYSRSTRYNTIGALTRVLSFSYLGCFFANIPLVKSNLSSVLGVTIVISILPAVIEIVRTKYVAKE